MNSDHRQTLYAAGKIIKVFGIKGEVKIYSYARSSQEYEAVRTVKVGADERTAGDRTIDHVRDRGGDIYIKFAGVDDRNAAEELVNCFVFVEESKRKAPKAGRHYIHELLGCSVVLEDNGRELGTLRDVMDVAGRQMYLVATFHGEVMMPAVDEFIASVDLTRRVISVRPPEGLFEGDAS
ncbi:MAG TPA: ribosome maturation factor RimM [Bacteroidota bacterium]|nr:ribosome maturation factor RimM [Bacteroidota bacterium]